jgi:dethiobiotin synthetase
MSPHLAAELAGVPVRPGRLLNEARRAGAGADALIVEGVGGLMVPLNAGYLVRDFAADLGLPLLIVARPRIGTINHTLLSLEAARAANLDVAGVVLTPWPEEPGDMERSNLDTISRLGRIPVHTLGEVYTGPPVSSVGDLPLEAWLGRRHAAAA